VTFAARSRATQRSKTALARWSILRCGFDIKSTVSAGQRSTRCTRPKSSGQVRRVTEAIRREMRRRAATEPVIGHLKQDHRMGRNYPTGRDGDRINAVLAAAGYNFSLLLRWFEELLRVLSLILCHALLAAPLHLTGAAKLSSRPTN
jgi:hypothetical protein